MTRHEEFLQIKRLFAVWIAEIEINNAFSYTDINRIAEGFCKMLLNKLYSYELEDLNKIQKNFPGVDLGDLNKSKVAFQITSRTDREKIYEGLEQVVNKKLDETFTSGIKFLILNNNDISFTKKTRDPSKILASFQYQKDILYPRNLIERIEEIYDEDDDLILFIKVKSLLEKEFGRKPAHSSNNILSGDLDLVAQLAKMLEKSRPGSDDVIQWTRGSAYIDLGLPQHKILSRRYDLVNSYELILRNKKLLWLEGNHSTGKSTIAILMGKRQ